MPTNELTAIAAAITEADRDLIMNCPGRTIRRSRIEVISDEEQQDKNTGVKPAQDSDSSKSGKSRSHVNRVWPDIGAVVIARNPWTTDEHQVQVVEARNRKSGREFVYNNTRYHSPSPMCEEIFGRRVSNGWNCICW